MRTVQIYRPDGTNQRLQANDELTGEDVLPGFRCLVSDFFPQPLESQEANGKAGIGE